MFVMSVSKASSFFKHRLLGVGEMAQLPSIKSTHCFSEDPSLASTPGGSQLPVTPALGNLMPSFSSAVTPALTYNTHKYTQS